MKPHALDEFAARVRSLHARRELDAAAAAVLDAFDAADVHALLLKGPALARLLYAEDENRGYSDVDVLVAPDDVAAARRVLSGIGYADASARVLLGVEDVAGLQHAEIWTRRGPRTRPLMIDLHWRLPGWDAPAQVTWDALKARRTWIDLEGRKAPVCDRDALALHVATHAAQHGPQNVKGLGDLARALDRWPRDLWRSAAQLAAEVEATPAFAAGLRLLPEGEALANDLGLPPTDKLNAAILLRDARPRGTFHLQALAEAQGVRRRAAVLRRSLFPTRVWIARRYPWAEDGGVGLVAAYAAHLISAPLWAVRAWRFRRRLR